MFLLLRRATDADRVAAEEGRQYTGGDADIYTRHAFANPVEIESSTAHAVEGLGNEEELDAQLRPTHFADDVDGELVARVELEQFLIRQPARGELGERHERCLQRFLVETLGHVVLLTFRPPAG